MNIIVIKIMKRAGLLLMGIWSMVVSYCQFVNKVNDPVEWVNPLMGTDSKGSLSNGNTYPAIA